MKELEALEIAKIKYFMETDESEKEREEAFKVLEKALTPPTRDEVRKELCKHYNNEDVFYDKYTRSWYLLDGKKEVQICEWHETLGWDFDVTLTPHLVTLIGRFYEGVEE